MKKSGIYCWASPSGKKYIGQTLDLERRKDEFLNFKRLYSGTRSKINSARQKYDKPEEWQYEVLEYCTKEELNEKELFWIATYKTFLQGYNSTTGGDANIVFTEEVRKKISDAHKGNKYNLGKRVSEETKKKMSEAHKGHYGWNKDMHHSEETKKKMSEAHKGNKYNLGKHVSDETRMKMSEAHKGHYGWNNGRKWTEETKQKISEKLKGRVSPHRTKVAQYTLDGEFVSVFDSLTDAAKYVNVSRSAIGKNVQGRNKTAGGYIWRYVDE